MNPDEQLRTVCTEAGFIRTVSAGMYCRTGEHVNDGSLPRTRRYVEVKLWIQKYTEFVMSKSFVNMKFMNSRFKSPLHLETTPMFGWSQPEAQIATWMSYDTDPENSLEECGDPIPIL